ncbi:ABC transporter ATP-binding protein [Thioalbus denitrificans]|uniref:NitT/TauT family transport system ATP-binding protein n=1 Tax=Thioalbus denitrificans TaxID=547122 RepID=A0A369BT86_9GAMM|nr:ABC transporter ATP-binding protein [Thioalbus denitrificans]RCX24773.1 NitT/TauT family transport system ATP-binding protein [Thioalbus denitrificans]
MSHIELPSYLDQSEAVRERFTRLKQRPVILEVKGLGKDFESPQGRVTALRDINFKTHRREFVCVIGPSGCGKSTLVRILAGLESHSSGEVLLDGRPVHGPGPDRGMVFQGYTLFPWLTVKQNVMFGLKMSRRTGMEDQEAMQWIDLVGLARFADSYPHQLSGGMKQRVAIARALANQPRVLLMDEPFGALDAQTRARMQAYLLDIWKNIDITIVFITHDLDEAIYLADRILVLKAHPGEVQELIEVPVPHPRNPDQFLSPGFLATKARLEALIHPPQSEETGLSEDHLNLVRMVPLDDEVSDVY